MGDEAPRNIEHERFSSGYEIEPFPGAHPSQDAPFATYPDRPRVALSRAGFGVQGRYSVPLTREGVVDVITRVVHGIDRLAILDIDSTSAHLARRASTASGAEAIILRFASESLGHTRIDGVERGFAASAGASFLRALFEGIARELDARQPGR